MSHGPFVDLSKTMKPSTIISTSTLSIIHILLTFYLLKPPQTSASSTPPPPPPVSSYTSVAILDKFGSSPQLRNALLASSRHGQLIIVAKTTKPSIISVSLRLSSLTSPPANVKKSNNNNLIHILSRDDDTNGAGAITGIIGSGLKYDILFIVKCLREYARRVWERYDIVITADMTLVALRDILLSFMGYDDVSMSGVSTSDLIGSGEDGGRMGRPLGVQSVIVSLSGDDDVRLTSVDPGGASAEWTARAMGRGADVAHRLLEERFVVGEEEDVREIIVGVLRDVIREMKSGERWEEGTAMVVCETLSRSEGWSVESIPFLVKR